MQAFDFIAPHTLEEVCQALEAGGCPVAGATDVLPQIQKGRLQADRLVDLSRLTGMDRINVSPGEISIGALVTFAGLSASSDLQFDTACLVQASSSVGCVQTRFRGTLGGNIANASPAGDSLPPLLVLDAWVEACSVQGSRRIPLAGLLLGPGKTGLKRAEVITQVGFPRLPAGSKTLFLKVGSRRGMSIAVVSVAFAIHLDIAGQIDLARVALGAVAPTAKRCLRVEAALIGQAPCAASIADAARLAVEECSPIDDVRSSAAYRRHAVGILVRRGLHQLTGVV